MRTIQSDSARATLAAPSLLAALLAVLLITACVQEPVAWLDRSEMADGHPSPLSFPGATRFDSAQSESSEGAEFSRTQDLLREAGAASVLERVLRDMAATVDTNAVAANAAGAEPNATSGGAGMTHAMPMAATGPLTLPGQDLGTDESPRDSARCARSLRVVNAPGRGRVAVWWSKRDRGRVFLLAAWQLADASAGTNAATAASDSARSWRGPIFVDTLDQGAGDANAVERGAVACDRAAPGVAVDAHNGYVHVAYALNAPEGPGVFYAHQMDPRAAFEPPKVMLYGDRRMGTARVATAGELVAVVYEDPNAPLKYGRIGLAVSRSAGHAFESRVSASRPGRAVDPYVRVRGRAIVVGWTDVDSTVTAVAAFRTRRATLR